MPTLHPTAIVDSQAALADDVIVEAYSMIGPGVTIGAGTRICAHTIIHGMTRIGSACTIGPAAYVGLDPQHLGFLNQPKPPPTWLQIGDRTLIRETASLHRSTKPGLENATRVGNDCFLMGGSHVGHDSQVGNHAILANGVLLGGHTEIGERAFIGGGTAVHQFCRIGKLAIVSGNEAVSRDIPPFAAVKYGGLKGYNAIGCRRAKLSQEVLYAIRKAYHCIHTHQTNARVIAAISETVLPAPEIRELLEFFAASKRGILPSLKFLNYLHGSGDE